MSTECKLLTFAEITTELSDGLHAAPIFYADGDYIFVNAKNLVNGRIADVDKEKKTSYEEYLKYKIDLDENTILYSIDGTIGNVAKYRGEKVVLGKGACYLKLKPEVDVDYIYFYLMSPQFNDYIHSMSTGSTIKHISLKTMRNHVLNLPDINTQKRISTILLSIQNRIDLNDQINQNLLQQGLTLFSSWFVDYVPFNGKEPLNWKAQSVYDLAEFINGAAFKKEEYAENGLPIIKISELKNGITDSTQYCCVTKDSKYYIDDHDILFSWSGNPDTSIDTFVWSLGKAILNQHTFRVVSKYNAPAFMYFLLKYLKPQFTHIASNKQTTGLGHVTVADLKRLQFRGNEDVITEFNKVVTPIYDLMFLNLKEIQILSSIRDSLLPQIMSGEIDVSEIDL